nr:glutamate synthase subunit alpha [Candidatus Omnitrophota bacterium]
MRYSRFPEKQGLYDPRFEHDSCGVGFVCNVDGAKSHDIVENGLKVLRRLSHRGAVGADPKTGDGAGILMQVPHKFLIRECGDIGITLPREGEYGVGLVFLPTNKKDQDFCIRTFEGVIRREGLVLLGWRDVPCNDSMIGTTARDTKPVMRQIFISKNALVLGKLEFERKLYIVRRQIENIIHRANIKQRSFFYITNFSSRTLSYKGLLMPSQMEEFFLDLKSELIESALALVHSRYSTNTFPTWDLAQPFRFLAHNGEINTLRGNINWMRARERLLESELFGKDIKKIKPVVVPGGSDSATIDNVFELLVLSGRSLSHSMMMLIPAAWEKNKSIDKKLKDFYKYHASIMEPWDGPAAIAFTDGERIGAVLDRNGLRPARYLITKSGLVVMASEVGVLDLDPSEIEISGRLEPGRIFFIDTEEKRIIDDSEIKRRISTQSPYSSWLKDNAVELDKLSTRHSTLSPKGERVRTGGEGVDTLTLQKAFGYTREDLKFLIEPMAETGEEPIGSMGNDTPHAVLAKRPKLLYNYFKQLFAQVTNPAIDSIREDCVMSLESFIGPEKNILGETPEHCHRLRVKNPILTNKNLEKIRNISV